jgi:hypothetical protein
MPNDSARGKEKAHPPSIQSNKLNQFVRGRETSVVLAKRERNRQWGKEEKEEEITRVQVPLAQIKEIYFL